MSEPSFIPADHTICYGWAYEACGRPAVMCALLIYHTGGWELHSFCLPHLQDYLDGRMSLVDFPTRELFTHVNDVERLRRIIQS